MAKLNWKPFQGPVVWHGVPYCVMAIAEWRYEHNSAWWTGHLDRFRFQAGPHNSRWMVSP